MCYSTEALEITRAETRNYLTYNTCTLYVVTCVYIICNIRGGGLWNVHVHIHVHARHGRMSDILSLGMSATCASQNASWICKQPSMYHACTYVHAHVHTSLHDIVYAHQYIVYIQYVGWSAGKKCQQVCMYILT